MKAKVANLGKVVYREGIQFSVSRSCFKFSRWQRDPQVSDNEIVSENVFIFRFTTERGPRMPLPDSNLERGRIDS